MLYEALIQDFAQRTLTNLQFIQNSKLKGDSVYEVTALISSFLGLVVFPKEKLLEDLPTTPIADLKQSGWPDINSLENGVKTNNLREFIVYLRHAIAHGNIRVDANGSNEISDITFWNRARHQPTEGWKISLSVPEINQIATLLGAVITSISSTRQQHTL